MKPETYYKKIQVQKKGLLHRVSGFKFQVSRSRGFTLLETLIAGFVILLAIVSLITLITRTVALGGDIRSRHIAANLVQEGAEIVHNIRHTNWVAQLTDPAILWDDGLSDGIYCVNYNTTSVTALPCVGTDQKLYLDAQGYYVHGSGQPTVFSRYIMIQHQVHPQGDQDVGTSYIRVRSIVEWGNKQIIAEDHLYDWR